MARLPDPRAGGDPSVLAEIERMAQVRSHADGRAELGSVYLTMFNNPEVARLVGALGEHLRFHGRLPDQVREAAILRLAALQGMRYEWAHHVRPAKLAGLDEETIAALAKPATPSIPAPGGDAVLEAVGYVNRRESIPDDLQSGIVAHFGNEGVVEIVALCGLYSLIGDTIAAFDVEIEPGLADPPFSAPVEESVDPPGT